MMYLTTRGCKLGRGLLLASILSGVILASSARADGFFYDFRDVFSGETPGATPPWVLAEFHTITPGNVELTVSAPSLMGPENVFGFYLNLNPVLNPNMLSAQVLGTTGSFAAPALQTGTDAFKADGDGYYDVLFMFSTVGNDDQLFTAGDSLRVLLTGIPGLTAGDFAYLSKDAGGYGPFYAAAHVQRIGAGAGLSGWIYPEGGPQPVFVPEPSAAALLVLAGGLMLRGRRTRPAAGDRR